MSENDQFDKLMRQRFDNESFEFDERHWQQAEAMILEKERKERNRHRVLGFLTFVFLMAGCYFFFKGNSINAEYKFQNIENQHIVNKESVEHSFAVPLEKENKQANDAGFQNDFIQEEKVQNEKSNLLTPKVPQKLILQNQNRTFSTKNKVKLEPADITGKAVSEVRYVLTDTKTTQPDFVQMPEATPSRNEKQNSLNLSIPALLPTLYPAQVENQSHAFLSKKMLQSIVLQDNTAKISRLKNHRLGYYATAGTFISRAYSNITNIKGSGFSPTAGLGLEYRLTADWSISAGFAYIEKHEINSPKVFRSEYFEGEFGKRTEEVTVDPIKLQYIQVPVLMHYQFRGSRQQFMAGVSLMKLLTTLASVETSEQATGQEPVFSTRKEFGYSNGFEKYDIGLLLGYSCPLTQHFGIAINFQYGLVDITRNTYYENNSTDENIGLQLFLKYQF